MVQVDLPVQYAAAWAMPSTSSPRMSCRGRQLSLGDRRELKGASWVHGIFMQVLTVWDSTCTFFAKTCPARKKEFWSFQIWGKRIILSMLRWIQELSVNTLDAACGSLWAASRSGREILHYETVGNLLCDKRSEYGGKFSLRSSTTSRSALWSSQVF